MMTARRLLPLLMLLSVAMGCAYAQRRVTPVAGASQGITGVNENRRDSLSGLLEMTDETGKKIYIDTVNGREMPDSLMMLPDTARVPAMIQPLIYSATAGLNLWDPLMRALGTRYGLVEVSAELSLHNRYVAVLEAGLGAADATPDGMNYTYRVGVTPYFRLGANYNFLYNSNPDYMVYAGLRYGFTRFSYQLRDVTIDDPYWGGKQVLDFPRQTSSVNHLHVLFGLRVKVWKQLALGWEIRYRAILGQTSQPGGDPWYIPGFGTSNSHIGASFSVYYTFPLGKEAYHKDPQGAIPSK